MASPKKSASKQKIATDNTDPDKPQGNRRRQWRMFFGLLFLVFGAFTSLAIISYFFSWRSDQDLILSSGSLQDFIFRGKESVSNWGGRLGAAWAHLLVYRGAGIAALIIGLWAISTGVHILYGKRMAALMRYLRWSCLILLITATVIGMLLISSFSVTVIMGQDLLPGHLGVASGLMVGFAIGAGGIAATMAILVHSFGEFNLQIPANALLLFIIMAITWRSV